MAPRTLSLAPCIDATAQITDCSFGRYTAVGERSKLLEVQMGDYSYVVNDSDIAYATIRKVLFDCGHDPGSIPAIIRCSAQASRDFISRQRLFSR